MMHTRWKLLWLFSCAWLLLWGNLPLYAQREAPESKIEVINQVPPAPTGAVKYVTDLGDLLTDEDEALLQSRLAAVDAQGGPQVAVLTLPSTDRDLSEFSPVIMNQWGLGHKEQDDGVLILANAQRIRAHASGNRIFIGTGSGAEGVLPDAVVGRILDEQAIPAFEKGDYSGGIRNTALAVLAAAGYPGQPGEPSAPSAGEDDGGDMSWIVMLVILFIILSFFNRGRRGGGFYMGGGGFGGGFGGGGGSDGGGFGGGSSSGGGAGR